MFNFYIVKVNELKLVAGFMLSDNAFMFLGTMSQHEADLHRVIDEESWNKYWKDRCHA